MDGWMFYWFGCVGKEKGKSTYFLNDLKLIGKWKHMAFNAVLLALSNINYC